MRSKRALALAMAGAMMAGAFATAMPVMAEGNTTQVRLVVAKKNTYTMTVPAATTLDLSGSVTMLQGGVTISSNNDMEDGYAVKVTASSKNNWRLQSISDNNTYTIGYTLYSNEAGTVEIVENGLSFQADDVNNVDGSAKCVYAKVDTNDAANAPSGDYRDTITFAAEVERQ